MIPRLPYGHEVLTGSPPMGGGALIICEVYKFLLFSASKSLYTVLYLENGAIN